MRVILHLPGAESVTVHFWPDTSRTQAVQTLPDGSSVCSPQVSTEFLVELIRQLRATTYTPPKGNP